VREVRCPLCSQELEAKVKPGEKVIFFTPRTRKMKHGIFDGYHRLDPNIPRIVVTSREGTKYRVYRPARLVKKAPV